MTHADKNCIIFYGGMGHSRPGRGTDGTACGAISARPQRQNAERPRANELARTKQRRAAPTEPGQAYYTMFAPSMQEKEGVTMQIISIEAARQRREDSKAQRRMMEAAQVYADRARELYPIVIAEALQMEDAAEAMAILEQITSTVSTLHILMNRRQAPPALERRGKHE